MDEGKRKKFASNFENWNKGQSDGNLALQQFVHAWTSQIPNSMSSRVNRQSDRWIKLNWCERY